MVCRLLFVFVVSQLDYFFISVIPGEARSNSSACGTLVSLLFGSAARCLKLLNPWNAEGEGRSSEVRGGCECGMTRLWCPRAGAPGVCGRGMFEGLGLEEHTGPLNYSAYTRAGAATRV